MTYQKSILKPGLKIDVDALDTSVQLTTEASKTPNYGTFTFPWAQPFPQNDTSKSQCVGLSAIWPPLSLSAQNSKLGQMLKINIQQYAQMRDRKRIS